MNLISLSGVVQLPVVNKLRTVHYNTRPGTTERAQASLPVLAELVQDLDIVFYSIGMHSMLMMGRLTNKNIPSADRLKSLYCSFKNKLYNDPKFMRRVVDVLPTIAAKYSSTNIIDIISDDEFLTLLNK